MLTKTTIHDIARELNYSYGTIIRALNLSFFVSKKTTSAVKEKASELPYQLNKIASSLSSEISDKKVFTLLMKLIINKDEKSIVKPCEKAALDSLILIRESSFEKKTTFLK